MTIWLQGTARSRADGETVGGYLSGPDKGQRHPARVVGVGGLQRRWWVERSSGAKWRAPAGRKDVDGAGMEPRVTCRCLACRNDRIPEAGLHGARDMMSSVWESDKA